MTQLFFAAPNSFHIMRDTFGRWDWENKPLNVLVAFKPREGFISWVQRGAGWKQFPNNDQEIVPATCTPGVKTILDSGAFSAWKSGTAVSLDELIEECKTRVPAWDEVAALDVIGSASESMYNAVVMQKAGLPVIPVFHYGEDWGYLQAYKDRFGDRIGLGGIATGVGSTEKRKWLAQCFARAYPARFHGFGVASEDLLMAYPFFSCDTASWHTGLRYGRTAAFGDIKMPRKSELDGGEFEGSAYDMRFEIEHFLRLEAKVSERWKSELKQFETAHEKSG
jgi:hypothetical protein